MQTNLEELEQKVKVELVQGIGGRMIDGETKIQNIASNVAMMEQKMSAIEVMLTGMKGAGFSLGGGGGGGGGGGAGGDHGRGVLE